MGKQAEDGLHHDKAEVQGGADGERAAKIRRGMAVARTAVMVVVIMAVVVMAAMIMRMGVVVFR